jgi:hypothetical protein
VFDVELPPIEVWHEPVLKPDTSHITKELGFGEAGQLSGWISLGEPITLPISLDKVRDDDKDLRQFLELNGGNFKFYLVHLACTFKPSSGERFLKAWLTVQLTREDESLESPPIAWSMKPDRIAQPVSVSHTIQMGASLKLAEIVEGPEAGIKREREWTESQVFLEALNELQSNPAWEFTRTDTAEIHGGHRFVLVVRCPRETAALGMLRLSATVERKRLFVISYRTDFPGAPHLTFRMP